MVFTTFEDKTCENLDKIQDVFKDQTIGDVMRFLTETDWSNAKHSISAALFSQ